MIVRQSAALGRMLDCNRAELTAAPVATMVFRTAIAPLATDMYVPAFPQVASDADRHTTIAPARQSSTSRHLGMVSAAQKPQDIVLEPVFVGPILSDDGDSALRRHWRGAAIAAAGAREWSWPLVGVPAPLPGLSANARSTSASRW